MRRFFAFFLVFAILTAWVGVVAAATDPGPVLPAKAYLLMDATTGQVLFEHEGHTRLPEASTTKIMTAILALEKGNLNDVVTASPEAAAMDGTTIYLQPGEQLTLQDLLYGLMLESGNDTAVAIAEHIGGTEAHFVDMMNEKAKELGMNDTHYANSHGLDDPNHYTSAYDLAVIARYAMKNETFRRLVATTSQEIPGAGANPPRQLHSHDQLLGSYEGAEGIKNGYTDAALQTNVAAAKRNDTELIGVVLGSQDQIWSASRELLDYGFSHFRTQPIVKKGDLVATAPVTGTNGLPAVAAADLSVDEPAVGDDTAKQNVIWDANVKTPLAVGAHLGTLQAVIGDKVVGQIDLVSAQAVAGPAVKPTVLMGIHRATPGAKILGLAGALLAVTGLTVGFVRRG